MRILLSILLFAGAAAAEPAFRDLSRPAPRAKYDGVVIEWISQEPAIPIEEEGDRREPPDGFELSYTAHLRNLGEGNTEGLMVRWLVDGVAFKTETLPGMGAGQRTKTSVAWTADEGRHWVQCELVGRDEWLTFATDAVTVKLRFEKQTSERGDRDFGSLARRFQDSFADLHASWSAVRQQPYAPGGIEERFRIDDIAVYERGEGEKAVPPEFASHPDDDLVIVVDQGGPAGGFDAYACSIGLNAPAPGGASLFTGWTETALWRDIARSRGVPDFTDFIGREDDVELTPGGRRCPVLELRQEFACDTMADPNRAASWSEYTAIALSLKRGIARVGRADNPDNTFGHLWRNVPARIDLQVIDVDGKPRKFVEVEVYRPVRSGDGRPRIAADATPLFRGTNSDDGIYTLGDDPFGKRKTAANRAPWLLVVMKREGIVRSRYITLLEMNMMFWRDSKDRALVPVVWKE